MEISYDEFNAWIVVTMKAKYNQLGDAFAYRDEMERILQDPFGWLDLIRSEFERVFGRKQVIVDHAKKLLQIID
jgi:hypothetical protein